MVLLVMGLHHRDSYTLVGRLGWPVHKGLECVPIIWCVTIVGVVSLLRHHGDSDDLRFITGVTGGGVVTPLSAVRPCGLGSATKWALDTCGSPHLTMDYLQRELPQRVAYGLKSKLWVWMESIMR